MPIVNEIQPQVVPKFQFRSGGSRACSDRDTVRRAANLVSRCRSLQTIYTTPTLIIQIYIINNMNYHTSPLKKYYY